jgi:chromosome segregation ATPase
MPSQIESMIKTKINDDNIGNTKAGSESLESETKKSERAVSFEELENGAAVRFHPSIKDELLPEFKRRFKSAKWDSVNQRWKVGQRVVSRLKSYVEEIEGVAQKLLEDQIEEETMRLSEEEVQEIRQQVDLSRQKVNKMVKRRNSLEDSKRALEEKKNELESLKQELDDQKREYANLKQHVYSILEENGFNIGKIKQLQEDMRRTYNGLSKDKKKFHAAQNDLEKISDVLEHHGLKSVGVNELIGMNHNRPDRDKPWEVTEDDIMKIRVLE